MDKAGEPRLKLVRPSRSEKTVRTLERWLEAAKDGSLIGLAGIPIFLRHEYEVVIIDEAERFPELLRGLVRELDDDLVKIIHPRSK